ncbi:LysR family substrate-binding domain-containing protein [Saccharopolyspora sp. ID03-671]|uniref:LysR family substrate-binding domain-containing protein n=1 Tax=Saccharopolyspora sp. ID03-671 TaxID=3073066 RepID=UPI0032473B9A
MTDSADSFDLAYVPGVTPDKWARKWQEREPRVPLHLHQTPPAEATGLIRGGEVDAALLRLPIDRTGLHAIPLYTEQTVVVVPKDHLIAAADEVTPEDLAEDVVLHPLDDALDWERPPGLPAIERPATTADAIVLVAAGVGLLVVPQSLARLHHRKDLTYRPIGDVPESTVALSWLVTDETPDLMEQFIGIVRGRTVNSTRGKQQAEPERKAKKAPAKAQPAKPQPRKPGNRRGPAPAKGRKPRRR